MRTLSHIVVGTDLSDASKRALKTAAFFANHFDAKVTLCSVFDPTPFVVPVAIPGPSEILTAANEEIEESVVASLKSLREEIFKGREDQVEVVALRHPSAGEAITDLAREKGADLVIVGSHGRTGLRRVLLGSVAEKVVRMSPCDVHVSRSAEG